MVRESGWWTPRPTGRQGLAVYGALVALVVGLITAGATPARAISTATTTLNVTNEEDVGLGNTVTTGETVACPANDASEVCTLRGAVKTATDGSGDYTIVLPGGVFPVKWGALDLEIGGALTITGAGPASTTIDGEDAGRLFTMSGGTATISQLTMTRGGPTAGAGGAMALNGAPDVTLDTVTVSNNATTTGGAISLWSWTGSLTVRASTFTGNDAKSGSGGAIFANGPTSGTSRGTVTIENSTLSGDSATDGQEMAVQNPVDVVLDSVTVGGNGSIAAIHVGGTDPTVSFRNSILAAPCSPSDASFTFTSAGHNLENSPFVTGSTCDLDTGLGDQIDADPLLAALGSNGGPTQTRALQAGSPAIDAGDTSLATDQRGETRPFGTADDIGAFESHTTTAFNVNSSDDQPLADPNGTSCDTGNTIDSTDGSYVGDAVGTGFTECTLRGAIQAANNLPGKQTIQLPAAIYTLDQTGSSNDITVGDLEITDDLDLVGDGATTTVVDANGIDRVVEIPQSSGAPTVSITGLTLTGGHVLSHGGGIAVFDGATTLDHTIVSSSQAGNMGGGVYAGNGGTVDLVATEVRGNSAGFAGSGYGGGVEADAPGTATIEDGSLVVGNSAVNAGGGVHSDSTVTITDSAITKNIAGDGSSAARGGGLSLNDGGRAVLDTVTISGNTIDVCTSCGGGTGGGADVAFGGSVDATNVTVSGNEAYAAAGMNLPETSGDASSLTNVTIVDNLAHGGTVAGLLVHQDTSHTDPVTITNAVLARNTLDSGDVANCKLHPSDAVVTDGGGNVSDDASCGAATPVADARLGTLGDHGGALQTVPLLYDSPAIDAGVAGPCPTADERGATRPVDGDLDANDGCDAGAYEYQPPTVRWTTFPSGMTQGTAGTLEANVVNPSLGNDHPNTAIRLYVSAPDDLVPSDLTVTDGGGGAVGFVEVGGDLYARYAPASGWPVAPGGNLNPSWSLTLNPGAPTGTYRLQITIIDVSSNPTAGFELRTAPRLSRNVILNEDVAAPPTSPSGGVSNAAPVAVDDTAATPAGDPVTIDVLANDTDPDGDAIAVSSVGAPAHGAAETVDGAVRYTPVEGFAGEDTFTYTVSDGRGGTGTAVVTVTVQDLAALLDACGQAPDAFPDDDGIAHEASDDCLADLGLLEGHRDGTVDAEQPISRGQLAAELWRTVQLVDGRTADELCPVGGAPFTDTPGTTFATAIACLHELTVIDGYPDGSYHPGELVDRAQVASLLLRTAAVLGAPLPDAGPITFDDVGPDSAHADAIARLSGAGILEGYDADTFGPSDGLTRGQMASALVRLLEYLAGHRASTG